jgi:hypothetical protein
MDNMNMQAREKGQRVAIYLTEADLSWLEEMRSDIRAITGKRAPARATLLSPLVQAIREDDRDAPTTPAPAAPRAGRIEKYKSKFRLGAPGRKSHMTPPPPALKLKTQLQGLCHPPIFFIAAAADPAKGTGAPSAIWQGADAAQPKPRCR